MAKGPREVGHEKQAATYQTVCQNLVKAGCLEANDQWVQQICRPVIATQSDHQSDSLVKAAGPVSPFLRGLGEVTGYLPGGPLSWSVPGVPKHLQGMLGGGILGAGAGYGAGWLAGKLLPEGWDKKRLKRNLAFVGGALGAMPGVLASGSAHLDNRGWRDEFFPDTTPAQGASSVEMYPNPPGAPYLLASDYAHIDPNVPPMMRGYRKAGQKLKAERPLRKGEKLRGETTTQEREESENHYARKLKEESENNYARKLKEESENHYARKLKEESENHYARERSKSGSSQTGYEIDLPSIIPLDPLQQAVWGDPRVAQRLPLPIRAATTGLAEAAWYVRQQQEPESSGLRLITPMDMARVTAGMGSGYVSGAIVGKVLSTLLGLPQSVQERLKSTGMYAGAIAQVVPLIFGR